MEWHTKSRQAVLNELRTDPKTGHSAKEVQELRAVHGPNRLREANGQSRFTRLALQFTQFIILILISSCDTLGCAWRADRRRGHNRDSALERYNRFSPGRKSRARNRGAKEASLAHGKGP